MDEIIIVLVFIISLVLGLLVSWFRFRRPSRDAKALTDNALDSEKVELTANIKAKEEQIHALKADNQTLKDDLKEMGEQLKAEGEKRSAAEAINGSIPQLNQQIVQKETIILHLQEEITALKTEKTSIQTAADEKEKSATEKLAMLEDARSRLSDAFKALSAEALNSNNHAFLELASQTQIRMQEAAKSDLEQRQVAIDTIVKPIKESLEKVDVKLQEVEKARIEQYTSLSNEAKSLSQAQLSLQTETAKLVNALKAPSVRGRWGEITLKRVVELAGMVDHCDFNEQTDVETEDGHLRPDMRVNLPNDRCVVVDSKTPLSAYIEALEAKEDEERKQKLVQHAQQVKKHIISLSAKEYWTQFETTPEFVVLFIPGESFLSAAVDKDPDLVEFGMSKGIILATPITLIALLKTIHQGWRHEKIAENAKEISDLGKELYERIGKFTDHLEDVGKHLEKSVDSYNKAVGAFEGRVLVTTRRFKQLGTTKDVEIDVLETIDKVPRRLRSSGQIEGGEEG